MSRHPETPQLPVIAILDTEQRLCGAVVADTPERLWVAIQGALRRQRSIVAAPLDFATAMRRVEDEVYDAV